MSPYLKNFLQNLKSDSGTFSNHSDTYLISSWGFFGKNEFKRKLTGEKKEN